MSRELLQKIVDILDRPEPEPTPLQWWQKLGETNPLAAARYYLANRRAINEERDALATQENQKK